MQPRIGIGILIIKNQQLLLGERLHQHGLHTWAPPGGHLEFGESFAECAKREALEEIGVNIDNIEFFAVTNDIFTTEKKHYVSIFLTTEIQASAKIVNKEPHKTRAWQWWDIANLPANLFLPLKNLIKTKLLSGIA